MSEEQRKSGERRDEGVGRKEDVGRSGVYPASGGNAPDDAEIRTQGGWGRRGGRVEEPEPLEPAPPEAPLSAPDSRVTGE